jgi:hypothetical protein
MPRLCAAAYVTQFTPVALAPPAVPPVVPEVVHITDVEEEPMEVEAFQLLHRMDLLRPPWLYPSHQWMHQFLLLHLHQLHRPLLHRHQCLPQLL